MSLESAIRKVTGVELRNIPKDGKSRSFMSGKVKWWAISFDGCGSFGREDFREVYEWREGSKASLINTEKPKRKLSARELKVERDVVEFGNQMQDRGATFSPEELDRYIEALFNVMCDRVN